MEVEEEGEEEEEEEDSHVCGKCHQTFLSLETYLRHKMKEHKVKLKYCKTSRHVMMPKLIIKQEPTDTENVEPTKKKGWIYMIS